MYHYLKWDYNVKLKELREQLAATALGVRLMVPVIRVH